LSKGVHTANISHKSHLIIGRRKEQTKLKRQDILDDLILKAGRRWFRKRTRRVAEPVPPAQTNEVGTEAPNV